MLREEQARPPRITQNALVSNAADTGLGRRRPSTLQLEAPCHAGLPKAGARGLPRDLLLPGDLDLVFGVAESLLDDPAVDAFFAAIGSLEYLSGFVCLLPGLIDVDLLGA